MKGYAVASMRYYPKHAKRPRRKLARLAYDLTFAERPSSQLDARIHDAMARFIPDLPKGQFSSDFSMSLKLLPKNWWWHVSHMEAEVTPTSPVKGAERVLSNAKRYDDEGRPIGYSTMLAWDYDRVPLAFCASLLSAVAALQEHARQTVK